MSEFTKKLINLRESHDWSKTYVANHLGLKNMQTYANWEYGKSEPDNEMLAKIARLFDVSVDFLVGNESNKTESKQVKQAEITDDQVVMTFEGKPIPPEDLDLIKRLLRGKE